MRIDEVRTMFANAGHCVSARDDVDESAASWFLGCKPKTLRNWRCLGVGPAHVKLGRAVRYPLAALFDYLNRHVIRAA